MYHILLDAGGAALLILVFGAGLLFLLLAIVIEAFFIKQMLGVPHFGKAMLHSFLANLATVVAGYLLIFATGDIFFDYIWASLAVCYVLTVLIEGWVLHLLNREQSLRRTLQVSLYMNIVTYILLYAFVFSNR